MIKKYGLVIFITFFVILNNKAIEATSSSKFSILTNTPGDELYKLFGHTALRFQDTSQNIDIVYNYGTFDFRTPNFYIKFAKGKLNYFLSIETFNQYIWSIGPTQTIYEQNLDLSKSQKIKLANFLNNNYLPQNRYYLYDFFYDNCATRVRDVLKNSFGDDISYDSFKPKEDKSFRQLLKPYFGSYPWLDLGINLIMGIEADKTAKPLDYFFLPEYVMEAMTVSLNNNNSEKDILLVADTKELVKNQGESLKRSIFLYPSFLFWMLFITILLSTIMSFKRNKVKFWIDRTIYSILGILGILLTTIWVMTDHIVLQQNLNVLWAIPLHVIACIILKAKRLYTPLKYYFQISSILSLILLIGWALPVLPLTTGMHAAILPVVLISLTRSLRLYIYYKNTT